MPAFVNSLPPNYYKSFQFIGLVVGFCLGIISTYVSFVPGKRKSNLHSIFTLTTPQVIFVMATTILAYTNADIGRTMTLDTCQCLFIYFWFYYQVGMSSHLTN